MIGSARVFIPEGCARIAQRFSVGARRRLWPSPEGTAETARALGRPFGTYFLRLQNPTLKRWAIIRCPSGTPACANAIQRKALNIMREMQHLLKEADHPCVIVRSPPVNFTRAPLELA